MEMRERERETERKRERGRGQLDLVAIRTPNISCKGHAMAQLVEVLSYELEGRGFDSRWCHWNFSLTESFRPHCGPGVDSVSNRNEYQEYFLGVKATGA